MEIIFPLVVSILLLLAAFFDYRRKEVPDLITSTLWGSLVLHQDPELAFAGAGVVFALLYGFTTISLILNRKEGAKPALSWADILGIPPVAFSMMAMQAPPELFAVGLAIPVFWAFVKKEPMPMFPSLALVHIGYFAIMTKM